MALRLTPFLTGSTLDNVPQLNYIIDPNCFYFFPQIQSSNTLCDLKNSMKHKHTHQQNRSPLAPLTSDIVFKYIFGSEQSTTILRDLLSAVREDVGYAPVASVEIRNPFNEKDADEAKLSYVDIRARDTAGNIYTVEMQAYSHQGLFSRILYYWAKAYSDQLKEGDLYTHMQPVISVNFLNFPFSPPESLGLIHSIFIPTCQNTEVKIILEDMALHFVSLPVFRSTFIKASDTTHRIMSPSTALEQWLYYIVWRDTTDPMEDPIMKQVIEDSPVIAAAEQRYQRFNADEQLRSRMDARDKFIRTQAQLLHDAKEDGLRAGHDQGLQQGLQQGSLQATQEMVREMKKRGLATEVIAGISGLSEEDIAQL